MLGRIAFERGDRDEGIRLSHEAADEAERDGFTWWRAVTFLSAAEHLIVLGDPEAAAVELRAALEPLVAVQDHVNIPIAVAAGSAIAAQQGDATRAGTLWGAVEAIAEREPKPATKRALEEYQPYLEAVRGAGFERERVRGLTLSLEEALRYALSLD
jgi:hypothetical protein